MGSPKRARVASASSPSRVPVALSEAELELPEKLFFWVSYNATYGPSPTGFVANLDQIQTFLTAAEEGKAVHDFRGLAKATRSMPQTVTFSLVYQVGPGEQVEYPGGYAEVADIPLITLRVYPTVGSQPQIRAVSGGGRYQQAQLISSGEHELKLEAKLYCSEGLLQPIDILVSVPAVISVLEEVGQQWLAQMEERRAEAQAAFMALPRDVNTVVSGYLPYRKHDTTNNHRRRRQSMGV